jgi:Sulfotransferase family
MTASAEPLTAVPSRRERSPDFFIVGHPKCGTTALYEMLRVHPRIFMPELKEPWYLASDMKPRFPPPRSASPPETLADYLSLFAAAGEDQRVGEASSAYLLSRTAAAQIAELRPDARIIAILREPASFLRSLHLQLLGTHVEGVGDLRRAIELEPLRRQGKKLPRRSHRPQLLLYSDHVRYVEQLRRYRERFSAEQLLILIYDDFRSDNAAVVRSVFRHLDVEHDVPVVPREANPTRTRMRSQRLDEALNMVSVGRGPGTRAVKSALKALSTERLRDGAMRMTRRRLIHGKPPPPDERLMSELRRRFAGEVVALSEYLDRDLVRLWGYDDIA